MRNIIISATDSLSFLLSFPNCDDTTVDSIIVNCDVKNMTSVTGNYRSGSAIDWETIWSPLTHPEDEIDTEA